MSDMQGPNMSRAWNLDIGSKLLTIMREEREKAMATIKAIYSPDLIGRAVFHINTAKVEDGSVSLDVIVGRGNNETEQCQIVFPVPPEYQGHEAEVPQFSGMHMAGFANGLLADARTVWGYVCPCNFD